MKILYFLFFALYLTNKIPKSNEKKVDSAEINETVQKPTMSLEIIINSLFLFSVCVLGSSLFLYIVSFFGILEEYSFYFKETVYILTISLITTLVTLTILLFVHRHLF
ncbi:hypothetical protein NGRA_0527 [Nosema granulosis]|uniref:Uncharacterized protein n=1 Tax=Nosema granulosis TaxID=83296 RepID=A0A9P6KZY9_9MICR|nr:hypothetical protein NGRA_0527 [Nosema granulosis]